MYAKSLESVLDLLLRHSDLTWERPQALSERFEKLRGSAKLPRGREHRAKELTTAEIINAVLGLVPANPSWAAQGALVLASLRPVGGKSASFLGSQTLGDALGLVLESKEARSTFKRVRLTVAETGTNSNGGAAISYNSSEGLKEAYFVPKEVISLLQPGKDLTFNPESRHSPTMREFVLDRSFFEELAREIHLAAIFKRPPPGDGSEYDSEEAREERYRKLGVTKRSRFLNVGVENQVTWPKQEMSIEFDNYTLILFPQTKENVQSVHIDLVANKIDEREARTVINRFLSVMSWCDDNFASAGFGLSGTSVPSPVSKRNLGFHTTHNYYFDRKIPNSDEARRALALYREAINARVSGLISYAVLNFYKIIEIKNQKNGQPIKWLAKNFSLLKTRNDASKEDLQRFDELRGDITPEVYIHKACRIAVAHASDRSRSDPDDADEVVRLHLAACILQPLARIFIEQEFGISKVQYSGD